MGYLDNTTVTVDAILTNKGRQILANGGRLNITKFALSDDEVDYNLWNPAHSLGTNYYGSVIENMPILEASPDESQMLRYKLVTLPKAQTNIPVVTIAPATSHTFRRMSESLTVTVSTYPNDQNRTLGYTAILADDTVATLEVPSSAVIGATTAATGAQFRASGLQVDNNLTQQQQVQATFSSFLDDEVGNITTSGNTVTKTSDGHFTIKPKGILGQKSTLITFIANETGGFKTFVVTCVDTVTSIEAPMFNNDQL